MVVDPRRAKVRPGQGVAEVLAQAVALFRAKDWAAGARPEVVRVHPSRAKGLAEVAQAQRLAVLPDPLVQAGIWWLGGSDAD